MKLNITVSVKARYGFTLVEVVVACALLGVLVLSLFGAFSSGLNVVQSARENLRATQILVQKMETIRLLTWDQTVSSKYAPAKFTELYDPLAANSSGARYTGSYITGPAPADIPADYRGSMRAVTVTIFWTNSFAGKNRIQSRQVQTLVAQHGMQNYIVK